MSKREFRILQDGKGSQQEAGQYRKQRYWRDEGEVVQSTQKPRSSAWITFHDSKTLSTVLLQLFLDGHYRVSTCCSCKALPSKQRRESNRVAFLSSSIFQVQVWVTQRCLPISDCAKDGEISREQVPPTLLLTANREAPFHFAYVSSHQSLLMWLRIHLAMQGTLFPSLVWEDPTYRKQLSVHHNCGTQDPDPQLHALASKLPKPARLKPRLCHKRRPCNEKPAHCDWRKPRQQRRPSTARSLTGLPIISLRMSSNSDTGDLQESLKHGLTPIGFGMNWNVPVIRKGLSSSPAEKENQGLGFSSFSLHNQLTPLNAVIAFLWVNYTLKYIN
ncbi:hypothetical protein MJG53_011412 [Ovis ammon polii x Ovis aries]|uniref:Uncharacterized protein n=1 Tax=Ovis ammon polii x Ovis aries TaxID=2918886 RepID=A0ACB9UTG7_9CETA|nr:hypothetical protein MJG53_011412 [Ovis ammon polii x Ovis aries]